MTITCHFAAARKLGWVAVRGVRTSTAVVVTGLMASFATAQSAGWKPTRPVTIVVPYAPGGGADAITRPVAKGLEAIWGQSVVVENVGGAEGLIGTNKVIGAKPDGYTLLLQVSSYVLTRHLPHMKGVGPIAKIAPIAAVAQSPTIIVASPTVPGGTLADVMNHCRSATDKPCGIGGAGNFAKMGSRHLATAAKVPTLVSVSYRGQAQTITDLLGGNIALGFLGLPGVPQQVRPGGLKALAVLSPARIKSLPNVPTAVEQGLENFTYTFWFGIFAPKETPPRVIRAIAADLRRATADPTVARSIEGAGVEVMYAPTEELARFLSSEARRYGELVKTYPLQ